MAHAAGISFSSWFASLDDDYWPVGAPSAKRQNLPWVVPSQERWDDTCWIRTDADFLSRGTSSGERTTPGVRPTAPSRLESFTKREKKNEKAMKNTVARNGGSDLRMNKSTVIDWQLLTSYVQAKVALEKDVSRFDDTVHIYQHR